MNSSTFSIVGNSYFILLWPPWKDSSDLKIKGFASFAKGETLGETPILIDGHCPTKPNQEPNHAIIRHLVLGIFQVLPFIIIIFLSLSETVSENRKGEEKALDFVSRETYIYICIISISMCTIFVWWPFRYHHIFRMSDKVIAYIGL